jgi:hypothetical protein
VGAPARSDPPAAPGFGDCTSRYLRAGAAVRCQLAIGPPPPHAAEVGPKRELVTWHDPSEVDSAAG